jgi:phosphohistidine phosphatase
MKPLMKTLFVFRHAKTEPNSPEGDKARVLTPRGERDSRTMGERLRVLAPAIDIVVSSDAVRARQTAEIAARAAGLDVAVAIEPEIYAAPLDTLLDVVRSLPDAASTVVIIGHNPGFEDLSTALAPEGTEPVRLPTAGLAHLEFPAADRWREVREGTGRLVGVYTPKEPEGQTS